ncbi:Aste57867_22392 [Aphanomyces stellatus]|uniref:Aste57867_22392 protein n=1 Tax=Aphanomyces stellatus TaxID=120398 RepID=A0A485LKU3_9STRA|nr:hypothetical protein As57867_022322 [Aphanomyces stellatus]VFT99055.1 Aste57867_22392 [Aphanomyces stellatus]
MNNTSSEAHCFWNASQPGPCRKQDWGRCGYDWLAKVPVGLVWLVWFFAGTYALSHFGTLKFDTKIHDPLGQGIAIALSQRKASSVHRPWVLRYIKLCAIWAEWPTFTFTPLTIAFKIAGEESMLRGLNLNFNGAFEVLGITVAGCCGVGILVLRHWRRSPSSDALLKKMLYPITFDLFFIPTMTIMARIGTCPEGFDHIGLPSGATCECVDNFAVFWFIGFGGFVLLYGSAMYYKMHIEPHGTTMDFRFQTSFQIMMAMARTVNPLVSILVILLNVQLFPARATPITCAFLLVATYLLVYSYKTQPVRQCSLCIGSGRIPNNIRVVSFSSSVYTSLCVFVFCISGNHMSELYFSLVPLPLIWVVAWLVNDARAKLFYIPYLPITDLLAMKEERPRMAGVIAALYVDPTKVHAEAHDTIIARLYAIARSTETEPLSRTYALRTLWFFHAKSFRRSKGQFGEPDDCDKTLPPKLWFKDTENADRAYWSKSVAQKKATKHAKVKICRIDNIMDVVGDTTDVAAGQQQLSTPLASVLSTHRSSRTNVLGSANSDVPSMAMSRKGSTTKGSEGPLEKPVVDGDDDEEVESETPSSPRQVDDHEAALARRFSRHNSIAVSKQGSIKLSAAPLETSVIRIREKQWISSNEEPVVAVERCEELYKMAKDVLFQCTSSGDKSALLEASIYLLQLYQARYLRMSKAMYVRVLSSLCATTENPKVVVDAVHTMHKLLLDHVLTPHLWLGTPSSLDLLLCALDHPSLVTVAKTAIVAKAVLGFAETVEATNMFALLTPESITRVRSAFLDYHANYQISVALEDLCTCLHRMEVSRGLRRRDSHKQPTATNSSRTSMLLVNKLAQNFRSGRSSADQTVLSRLERSIGGSRRFSLRVQPDMSAATFAMDQLPSRDLTTQPAILIASYDAARPTMNLKRNSMSSVMGAPLGAVSMRSSRSHLTDESPEPSSPQAPIVSPPPMQSPATTEASFQGGAAAKVHFLFVQADVIDEIHRRRTIRTQFEQALLRAYNNNVKQAPMNMMGDDDMTMPDPSTPAPTQSLQELPESFGEIMELYAVPGCALEGMLATVVEPHIKRFFEAQVMPFMIIR